jgi:hypothetical protein
MHGVQVSNMKYSYGPLKHHTLPLFAWQIADRQCLMVYAIYT